MRAFRVTKRRYDPLDPVGARLRGGRWSSPGRDVLYGSECLAGSILEILVHTLRPRTLPGPHHGVELRIPDGLVERLAPDRLPDWHLPGSTAARAFGDRWLDEARSVALVVPSLPARPRGRTVVINPDHPGFGAVRISGPFHVPWDERLFA